MSEIDLHTHSTASDGTLSPKDLVWEAKRCGLKAIALTDHDTTSGLKEAKEAGKEFNIEVIAGCELSVEYPYGQMHILGLWLPVEPKKLESYLQFLRDKRHYRNKEILKKLQRLNIPIDYEEVKKVAKGESIGRPHIATVLVNKKIVSSVQEAFDKYIGPKGLAYVPKVKLKPKEAIEILKDEGATVILAHPFSLNLDPQDLKKELYTLKDWGLDGIEAYYSEHTKEQTELYLKLAKELKLVISGGSDFHGKVKKDIKLGVGKGNLNLPYTIVEKLKAFRCERGLPV